MTQPEIETQRLLLRPFHLSDAHDVQMLAGNKRVSEFTLNIPYPYLDGMAEEWISIQPENWRKGNQVVFAIVNKDTSILLGTVGLVKTKDFEVELGFWVGEPYWGQGYCTEAVKSLFDYSFEKLEVEKIIARYLSINPASGRVMEKVGMCYVGELQANDRNGQLALIKNYEISV